MNRRSHCAIPSPLASSRRQRVAAESGTDGFLFAQNQAGVTTHPELNVVLNNKAAVCKGTQGTLVQLALISIHGNRANTLHTVNDNANVDAVNIKDQYAQVADRTAECSAKKIRKIHNG